MKLAIKAFYQALCAELQPRFKRCFKTLCIAGHPLPVTQGGAMPDNTDLNPGDEAAPGTPGTGENLRPGCSGSGKNDGPKGEQCIGSGKVIEGIRGA
jgi:hypothetical protein